MASSNTSSDSTQSKLPVCPQCLDLYNQCANAFHVQKKEYDRLAKENRGCQIMMSDVEKINILHETNREIFY